MKCRVCRSRIALIALAIFGAIQLIPPPRAAPPVNGVVPTTPDVKAVLDVACWDCHSSETRWPGYSRIAPLSWWIGWHVSHGREYLNFTDWNALTEKQRAHIGHEIVEVVEEGEMPLKSYTWMHPPARLSAEQKQILVDWAKSLGGDASHEED